MSKSKAYAMARYFKQLGLPTQNWPAFLCNPISRMEQEEAIKKSRDRHRKKLLRKSREGREELRKEKQFEGVIRKVFADKHVKQERE